MFPPTCSLPVPRMQLHLYPQTAGCLLDHPLMCSLDACWALDEERERGERKTYVKQRSQSERLKSIPISGGARMLKGQ